MLTPEERDRYSSHLIMPGFSIEHQEKLRESRVFVLGLGGTGAIASAYLVAAGVGSLSVVDEGAVNELDFVDGVLYDVTDMGMNRAECIAKRLRRFNPFVEVSTVECDIEGGLLSSLLDDVDFVVCCLDRNRARLMVNEACLLKSIPATYCYVHSFTARIVTVVPGRTGCLNCLVDLSFPEYRRIPKVGVGSAVAGVIQASEAIKSIAGFGEPKIGQLILVDLNSAEMFTMKFDRDPNCKTCGGIAFGEAGEKSGVDKT